MNTENFGFSLINKVSDLGDSYNSDISLIDKVLKVMSGIGDGSSVTVDTPVSALTGSSSPGGDLPPESTYWYKYTFIDPASGLESSSSPAFQISTNDLIPSPNAPSLEVTTSGGTLSPGTYNYALSAYYSTSSFETAALNESSVFLYSSGGSDQAVTLTLPALGDATGFNVYRRSPGNVSFYFIGSTTDPTFVDDGLSTVDYERLAPVSSSIVSNSTIELTLGSLPTDYHWKIYRTDIEDDFVNSYIGVVTDGSLSFADTGFETQYGTPPSATPVIVPGNVGLRSGPADPESSDGNEGDWWINTVSNELFGPKQPGDTWPGPINLAGSSLDSIPVECPPGEITLATSANNTYIFVEGSEPLLGLPPAAENIGKTFIQLTALGGATGSLVEVIPPDPERKPTLDFTAWLSSLSTTDFGAGDTVDFDLDGSTITATFSGVMTVEDIATALLTPLTTAGATYIAAGASLFLSSPTSGGSLSITDPGSILDFSSVVSYGLGGFIRTIDNFGGGLGSDVFYGPGTSNPDYEFIGGGYGTHSVPSGYYPTEATAVVKAIPDDNIWTGARYTAVIWPVRAEYIPNTLLNNVNACLSELLNFQSDVAGDYTYKVTLTDVDGTMIPSITLVPL